MSLFDPQTLLGKTYEGGITDCYGMVRAYYKGQFGITLPNYARPLAFDHYGLDLVGRLKAHPDYTIVPKARMEFQVGDVFIFYVASTHENHFGIYIGNNIFIHHLVNQVSCEQNLDDRWFSRLGTVLRHVDVEQVEVVDLWSFIPESIRGKYGV